MKRAQRLHQVQQVVDDAERKRAEKLGAHERRVAECEAKLAELENYQANYSREFSTRAKSGMGGVSLRDYQSFLARLGEAVRQQIQIVARARGDRDRELENWQIAAQRAQSVGKVVQRWQSEDRRALERHEQSESDERSQRSSSNALYARIS
jgi:flagellar protein FliJ